MKVATSAQSIDVEAPNNAARLPGEPFRPSNDSRAAIPTTAVMADPHALLVGEALPPLGSAMARNKVSETHVSAAAHQVMGRIDWWSHSHRRTNAKTSSVTRRGCTNEIAPLWRAMA